MCVSQKSLIIIWSLEGWYLDELCPPVSIHSNLRWSFADMFLNYHTETMQKSFGEFWSKLDVCQYRMTRPAFESFSTTWVSCHRILSPPHFEQDLRFMDALNQEWKAGASDTTSHCLITYWFKDNDSLFVKWELDAFWDELLVGAILTSHFQKHSQARCAQNSSLFIRGFIV